MKVTVQIITVSGEVSSVTVESDCLDISELDVKAIVKKARLALSIAFPNIFQAVITKLER